MHLQLKNEIQGLNNPDFKAEISLVKTAQVAREADYYGQEGSIRVDVLVKQTPTLACVYDLKTGEAGLSLPRTKEITAHVSGAFGEMLEIIVTEMRPTPWRPRRK